MYGEENMSNFFITLLFGWAGIHKFLEKKTKMGILYLLTFGLFGFGWLFDIVKSAKQLLNKPKYQITVPQTFEVAGTYYKQNEIKSILCENSSYHNNSRLNCTKIYKYNYTRKNAIFVPEPQNKHDKNAIMVVINNICVGYVPAYLCDSVHQLLKKHSIKNVEAQIYGGDYKYIDSEGDLIKEKAPLAIKINIIL